MRVEEHEIMGLDPNPDRARTQVKSLLALALDPAATEHEARTAAMAACKLIAEYDLLSDAAPARAGSRARARAPRRSPEPAPVAAYPVIYVVQGPIAGAAGCLVHRYASESGMRVVCGRTPVRSMGWGETFECAGSLTEDASALLRRLADAWKGSRFCAVCFPQAHQPKRKSWNP